MRCPRCSHDNPATARFCGDCGARLETACARCGQGNPPASRFCHACGEALAPPAAPPRAPDSYTPRHLAEKILRSKAALEGERKQVTVLFADLKSSMEMLVDRDPEEAREILDPVLEHMMDAVHDFEGTVNQVMGDGIMALFGAPVAHEDHALRACYAAMRMQERVARYAEAARRAHAAVIKIRVGLNSGDVVVRAITSDLRMDYSAVGQTTHLAARMEQIAEPGAIVITPDTRALVEGYVATRSLGPVAVRGLAQPMELYEVTGAGLARTRLEAAARRGLTRFVGRDAELDRLDRALVLAGEGRGQVVALVGEAGAGKSRLVYELTRSRRLEGWRVLSGASVSYGATTSYLPVIDLLKGYFGIQDRDALAAVRDKATGAVLALDPALAPILPALLALLDVPVDDAAWRGLDPPQRRRQTLDAVRRLLLREAREQPLVVIVEDLHWIDGETQALLDGLVDGLGAARLLLLVNYRPDYRHGWERAPSYVELRLDALETERAEELVDALLGADPDLGPLKDLLVRRGNPFFLEEAVRTLVETRALAGEPGRYRLAQPVHAIQVPSTVQVVLAARIDRLSPEDKRLLQIASVVGTDVALPLLRAVADVPEDELRLGLERLQAADFVDRTGLSPDPEYAFKHALTHEVAYGSLLHERRRDLHARIARAIEDLHADRLGEQIERLAHHAVRGELREKAVGYLRQAGDKAAARSALAEACAWLEQALDVLRQLPASRETREQAFDIRLALRPLLGLRGEYRLVLERLREAEALAAALDDDPRRGRVLAVITNAYSQLGELDEAAGAGTRALEIAGRLGHAPLRFLSATYLAQALYLRGELERTVELAAGNLAAVPPDAAYETFGAAMPLSLYDRYFLVRSLAHLGRFAEAARYQAEILALAAPLRHAFSVGMAHVAAAWLHVVRGEWRDARAPVERAIAAYRTGQVALNLPHALACSAWVLAELGEPSEAASRLREGERLLEREAARGVIGINGEACHLLGRAALALGRLDDARRLAARTRAFTGAHPAFAAYALHLDGDVAAHPASFDAAEAGARYRDALARAEALGLRPLAAHCHLGLTTVDRRTGRAEAARDHLDRATALYREMAMAFYLHQADAERGR